MPRCRPPRPPRLRSGTDLEHARRDRPEPRTHPALHRGGAAEDADSSCSILIYCSLRTSFEAARSVTHSAQESSAPPAPRGRSSQSPRMGSAVDASAPAAEPTLDDSFLQRRPNRCAIRQTSRELLGHHSWPASPQCITESACSAVNDADALLGARENDVVPIVLPVRQ